MKIDILDKENIIELLNSSNEIQNELFSMANEKTKKSFNNTIVKRAVIEITNYCDNQCNYCSMSKNNESLKRYMLSKEQILQTIQKSIEQGFKLFHIVSGETHKISINLLSEIVEYICERDCQVILVVGYRKKQELKQLFNLGARYYIAKFEISNEKKYELLNNKSGCLKNRLQLLYDLKDIGYSVGTGNIIGLPYQNDNDIYEDLLLLKKIQPFFASTSVFSPNKNTKYENYCEGDKQKTLNYIALMRNILDYPVYIPTNSSLKDYKYQALLSGANLVSINITPKGNLNDYKLYNMKRNSIEEIKNLEEFCLKNNLQIQNYLTSKS